MKRLCLLHTTDKFMELMTEPFTKPFLLEHPDMETFDIADSSLIAETTKEGNVTLAVKRRMYAYMMAAVDAKADGILVTCTSVNTATKQLRNLFPIPVISIEGPVAKLAVEKGKKIGVLSSVATSALPVKQTIQECAKEAGKEIEVSCMLAEGAFEALLSGDRALHDEKVNKALSKLIKEVDVVVFAQLSMALVPHPSYDIPVLKFGKASYEAAREAIFHA